MKDGKKCLIIEQLDAGLRASNVLLDKSNELRLLDSEEVSDFDDIKRTSGVSYVVLALDRKHATTIEKEIVVERARPKQDISENEMDQLVFKVLWGFLNEHRNWASKKMEVTDLDIVLSEMEIKEVLLDSENVLDPIGLKGSKITFRFRGTLIPRSSLEYIDSVKGIGREVKAVERLAVVSSFSPTDFVIHCGRHGTEAFVRDEKTLRYGGKHPWGTKKIVVPVSEEFSLSNGVALKIIERYFDDRLSERVKDEIGKKIKPGFDSLLKTVKGVTRKKNPRIAVMVPEPVFRSSLGEYRKAELFDLVSALESRGFSVIINEGEHDFWGEKAVPLALAGADLFSSHYENLNRMLRRRSKWLVPHSPNEKDV